MVQSVELLLDDGLDDAVRAEWDRLREAGVSSAARIRSETNRPHITLAVATSIPPEIEGDLRDRIDGAPIAVRLGGIVVFGDRHATLARLVVPTVELLSLHRAVFASVAGCPGIPPHIRPGEWTPHVTLARRVSADRIGSAIVATHAARHDLDGTAAGIRRWDGEAKCEWPVV